jgi:Peptidase_C39 like family
MNHGLLGLFALDLADDHGNALHLQLPLDPPADHSGPGNLWAMLHEPAALHPGHTLLDHGPAHAPVADHGPVDLHHGHRVPDHGPTHVHSVTDHGAGHHAPTDTTHSSHHEHALGTDPHAAAPTDHVGVLTAGDPEGDKHHWHYQVPYGDNSCAVVSQASILEAIFGHPFSEAEMAQEAREIGHYTPQGGTPIEDMGNILEHHGVHVTQADGTSYDRIIDALSHGEKVIVAVNANEIWHPQVDAAGHPVDQPVAGHAVWLTGVQKDDNGHYFAILNDTGTPDGAGERVPLEQFDRAWGAFGHHSVITHLHDTN